MDTPELEAKYLKAGADYLSAIQSLGLDPEALLWAQDLQAGGYVLVMVTAMFDHKGPLAISELLFEAYNKAATPQEIDPFVVRLHSPRHKIIPDLLALASGGPIQKVSKITGDPTGHPIPITGGTVADLKIDVRWVYHVRQEPKHSAVELTRRWQRFERNVHRIAA